MKSTDIITFKPDLFQEINVETYNAISDDNINRVFKLLREHNYLTISDIVTELEKTEDPKSESSVYRYLQKLVSMKIAVKAGKRIHLDQDITTRSEPLYCLTARAFIQDIKNIQEKDRTRLKEIISYGCKVLSQLHPDKELDEKKIQTIMEKYISRHFNDIKEIQFEKDEKDKKFLQSLDFDEIVFLYDTIRWFGFLLDDDFRSEYAEAVKKKE